MYRSKEETADGIAAAWRRHDRRWMNNHYVYAVVSRRSRGVSVGLNLSPGKACNFNCIYCQVDRKLPGAVRKVDLNILEKELDEILQADRNGSLYEKAPFNALTQTGRGVRDIAFSGDGEPTAFPRFREAIRIAARARRRFGLNSSKLILLTNAAYLDKPGVQAGLAVMDENNGEIWAKLDAGTEEYFRKINRPNVPLKRILDNILEASRIRSVIIQSLWFRVYGAAPPAEEIEAYCGRLNSLISGGGKIKAVQLYTIARDPAEVHASPLSNDELDQVASIVTARIPIAVEIFYGEYNGVSGIPSRS
jgi:wyosine [tRNA(Phe)-imidazoG37] synthetase (radical SAM superfamily)